jgi:phage N-6-adenine-methyltransferase
VSTWIRNKERRGDWETPQELFDELNAEFGFECDLAATDENAKCERYITEEHDSLWQPWHGVRWCNPPYGRGIDRWVRKAYEASLDGATVVMLLPCSTDAGWWHDYAMKGEVRFIRGRVRFGGSNVNAPFPSAVVIFRGKS